MYIEDFYGMDRPQYLTLVNTIGDGCEVTVDRDEGWSLMGHAMGKHRYTPNGIINKTVGPGDAEHLDAVKQHIDCKEVFANTSTGVRRIKVIGEIVRP